MIGSVSDIGCSCCYCCYTWRHRWRQCHGSRFRVWKCRTSRSDPAVVQWTSTSRSRWGSTDASCWYTDARLGGRTTKETGYSWAGTLQRPWRSWRTHFRHRRTTEKFWRDQIRRRWWCFWCYRCLETGRHHLSDFRGDRRRNRWRQQRGGRRRRMWWWWIESRLFLNIEVVMLTVLTCTFRDGSLLCRKPRRRVSRDVVDGTADDCRQSVSYETCRCVRTVPHLTDVNMYTTILWTTSRCTRIAVCNRLLVSETLSNHTPVILLCLFKQNVRHSKW